MPKLLANNASSTLSSGISAVATALSVPAADASKFPTFTVGAYTLTMTLVRRNTAQKEIVVATSHDGAGNFTVTRGAESTTAITFSANDIVSARVTKGVLEAIQAGTAFNVANILDYGAVAGGSAGGNTTAILAAFAAADHIYAPPGIFAVDNDLTFPDGKVIHFFGAGPGKTFILQTNNTKSGIVVAHSALTAGGSISGMTVCAGANTTNTGDGAAGYGISLSKVNGNFNINNVEVKNFAVGIRKIDSWYIRTSDFQILYSKTAAIQVGPHVSSTGGNSFHNAKLSNFGHTGDNSASYGILVRESSGDYFSMIDATSFNNDIALKPDAGKFVLYNFFDTVLADTPAVDGWIVDGSGAGSGVISVSCVNCWASFATGGHGVHLKGNIDGFFWNGGRSRENGQHGFYIEGGINWTINGSMIARNSKQTSVTYDGVNVAAGVSSGAIIGCRIGNFDSTLAHQQLNGIKLSGASTNIRVIGNDLSNPGAGGVGLSNAASGTIVMQANLPAQLGYDKATGSWPGGCATSAIAAGSTVYLGPNGQNASENLALFVVPRACVVTGFEVATDAAPGVGKNFVYTLRKNNSGTALTVRSMVV